MFIFLYFFVILSLMIYKKLEKMIDDYFRCRWMGLYLMKMLRKQKNGTQMFKMWLHAYIITLQIQCVVADISPWGWTIDFELLLGIYPMRYVCQIEKPFMQCSVCIYKSVYNLITIEYCSRSMASNWLNFSIVRKEKAGKCNQFYVTPYGTAIRALKGLTKWIKVKLRNDTKKKIIIIWLYTLTYKT